LNKKLLNKKGVSAVNSLYAISQFRFLKITSKRVETVSEQEKE